MIFLRMDKLSLDFSILWSRQKLSLSGVGIVIEKGFQPGGAMIREKGIRVESLAILKSLENGKVEFKEEGTSI